VDEETKPASDDIPDDRGMYFLHNAPSETRANVYFVTHGHYPPSLGDKFRKAFE
jgi:hypothetical protein